jgi:hypothetical protein
MQGGASHERMGYDSGRPRDSDPELDGDMYTWGDDQFLVQRWIKELETWGPPTERTVAGNHCPLDVLDDAVLKWVINAERKERGEQLHPNAERKEHLLGPVELLMLQCVSVRFSRLVAELAEIRVRERETARKFSMERRGGCGRYHGREPPGWRVQIGTPEAEGIRHAAQWTRMLFELDCYDRRPLIFSKEPQTVRLSDTNRQVEVRALGAAVTVSTGPRCHRMRCGLHYADITLVEPGEWEGVLRVGIVQADFDCTQGVAACDTEFGWGWEADGSVWHNRGALRPMSLGTPTGLGGGLGLRHDTYGKWGARGDKLSLELDMGRGILTGFLNDKRIGIIATQLHRLKFLTADKRPLPLEFCFAVEMQPRAARSA